MRIQLLILVALSSMVLCGCAQLSFWDRFSIDTPATVMERLDQYIQSGELQRAFQKETIVDHPCLRNEICGLSLNLTPGNLLLLGLDYSLSHNSLKAKYCIMDSVEQDHYRAVSIKVDEDGTCSLVDVDKVSGVDGDIITAMRNSKLGSPATLVQKADEFIAKGKVQTPEYGYCNEKWYDFSHNTNECIECIIRKRIPTQLELKHLLLSKLDYAYSKGYGELSYCIKPSIYRRNALSVEFFEVVIRVKENGDCSSTGMWRGDKEDMAYLSGGNTDVCIGQNELDDIYETAFRYMFENEGGKDDLKIRFLSVSSHLPWGEKFLRRFEDEAVPVWPPEIKIDSYDEDFIDGMYRPNGHDALFYNICGVYVFDDKRVFVDCSVTWHVLAARGYIYLLERRNEKWQVIKSVHTWLS